MADRAEHYLLLAEEALRLAQDEPSPEASKAIADIAGRWRRVARASFDDQVGDRRASRASAGAEARLN
jgi:hypothetical protein